MSSLEVENIARRFIQVWSAGNLGIVDELAAPEIVVSYTHFPEPLRGAPAFQQALAQTYEYFPDIATTAEEVIAAGDRAVVHWTYRGTHQHGELFGMAAAGREVQVAGITTYLIEGGKVVAESGLVDTFSLMLQLGAAPAPARNAAQPADAGDEGST